MIRFNVVGFGFLNMEAGAVSLKAENQQYRFCDVSLGRTTEFSVPADTHNRTVLGFPESPAEYGEAMRRTYPAEMVYDGGKADGLLEVRAWDGGSFRCVFYFGASKTLESMLGRQLSDCVTTLGFVQWDKLPTKAFLADPATPVDVIAYMPPSGSPQPAPSVHVKTFCEDILSQLGAQYDIQVDPELWMVSSSMLGGVADNGVHLIQTGTANISVTQQENYLDVVGISLEWASSWLFGALVGGGSVAAKGFRVLKACDITFGSGIAKRLYLVKWQPELSQCCTLGGVDTQDVGDTHTRDRQPSLPLDGMTVRFKAGDVFFFAPNPWHFVGADVYYGYKGLRYPLDLTVDIMGIDQSFTAGQKWYLRNNMPKLTVFEFLRSVALATGNELTVTSSGTQPVVTIAPLNVGTSPMGRPAKLERVTSVGKITRNVGCWGDGTRTVRVGFESNGVVKDSGSDPVVGFFAIDNDQLAGEEEHKASFSEGGLGDDGAVVIANEHAVGMESSARWTLGLSGSQAGGYAKSYLGRVGTPDAGYADVAACSTCMECRCLMSEADFMRLSTAFGTVFQWRGGLYVWTEATWTGGQASLTLQKVSQLLAPTS